MVSSQFSKNSFKLLMDDQKNAKIFNSRRERFSRNLHKLNMGNTNYKSKPGKHKLNIDYINNGIYCALAQITKLLERS